MGQKKYGSKKKTSKRKRKTLAEKYCKSSKKPINYKWSSFSYRLGFKKSHAQTFIDYPEEKMWSVLEKAYGVKKGVWSTRKARSKSIC